MKQDKTTNLEVIVKKIMLVAAFLLLLSAGAFAESSVKLGPKLGVTMSTWTGDDLGDASLDRRTGIAFGGFAQFGIGEAAPFVIQPEILFLQKGVESSAFGSTEKVKLSYIEIPVLAKYNFPLEGNVKPNILVGPAVSILMSAKDDFDGEEEDIKDLIKSTEFSIVMGGGVDFTLPSGGVVTLDIRFDVGLSNVVDIEDATVKNSSYGLMAGYGFNI